MQDTAAGEAHLEPRRDPEDLVVDQLDAVAGDFGPAGSDQVSRRHPIAGQETLHVRGGRVAGRPGVDHHNTAPSPAQDEGGAQAGGSASSTVVAGWRG
jgi:hypothetical protein